MGYMVGIDNAVYDGVMATKNPSSEYCFALFRVSEVYKGAEIAPDKMPQANMRTLVKLSSDIHKKLQSLPIGSVLFLRGEIRVEQAQGNFPAKLSIALIEVHLKQSKVAAA